MEFRVNPIGLNCVTIAFFFLEDAVAPAAY
jgi:hypothetical protein